MKFEIITFGCKVNSYESQALKERLIKSGNIEAKKDESADYYFINTCAVTKQAENKDLKKVREIIRENPSSKIVVMGCSSQIHPEYYSAFSNVIYVIGTKGKNDVELRLFQNEKNIVDIKDSRKILEYDDISVEKGNYEARSYIKIQDGCDNFCSFCVVPFTRGKSRCRRHEEILLEARNLLLNGTKELIIGGINVGVYKDPNDPQYDLKKLLLDLVSFNSNFKYRIRVSSIEASQIDDEYIRIFKENKERLCPHFHIPLQSASPRILLKMNRRYSLDEFQKKIDKVKKEIPSVALSTDVIAGFPEESEEDFLNTYDFCKKNLFMKIHAFPYSERPLTKAISFKQVERSIRIKRVRELIRLSEENERQYRRNINGEHVFLLIESRTKDGMYKGHSENYLELKIKGDNYKVGDFIDVKLEE